MTMMSLGMFAFSLPTLAFQELQRRQSWRHARSARVGARDAVQFVGPDSATISLNGSAPAELMEGRASLDRLREMANGGEAWPLVDGAGTVYGAFVITAIDERQTHFLPDGTPRMIDFGIDLLEVDAAEGAARSGV
jgi:phage protein U